MMPDSRVKQGLVALVVIHILFGAQRMYKGLERRTQQLEHIAEKGHVDFFLHRKDPAAVPLVQWLLANTGEDAVVLLRGPLWQGTMEVVAALLHPRLVYAEEAVPAGARTVHGRPIARGLRPPLGHGTLVLIDDGAHLRLEVR
jgi:hypothetical protein